METKLIKLAKKLNERATYYTELGKVQSNNLTEAQFYGYATVLNEINIAIIEILNEDSGK